jgi:hypothetical protein
VGQATHARGGRGPRAVNDPNQRLGRRIGPRGMFLPKTRGRGPEGGARTVQNHLSSIYRKLGVKNRAEAVIKAIDMHLVERTRQ